MPIADDPSEWTSKPKEVGGLAKALATKIDPDDYHMVRMRLIETHNTITTTSLRRAIRNTLSLTPPSPGEAPLV